MHAKPVPVVLAIVALAAAITSCSSQGGSTAATTAAPPPQPKTTTAVSSPPPAAATSLDPCQLVTVAEASALAGATYGPGQEETGPDADSPNRCVYGVGTKNIFSVAVGQAPDAATAQSEWTQDVAKLQGTLSGALGTKVPGSFSSQDVSGIGDQATVGTLTESVGGVTINSATFALRKGATFVMFGNLKLNEPAPTADAMTAQAKTTAGRLP